MENEEGKELSREADVPSYKITGSFRLEYNTLGRLARASKKYGHSKSWIVQSGIDMFLDKLEKTGA